jgi:predicted outer membrane protein
MQASNPFLLLSTSVVLALSIGNVHAADPASLAAAPGSAAASNGSFTTKAADPGIYEVEVSKLAARGEGFDKAYVQKVGIDDHENDIKLFEKAAQAAQDADVKGFALKTLPVLKQHLAAHAGSHPMT